MGGWIPLSLWSSHCSIWHSQQTSRHSHSRKKIKCHVIFGALRPRQTTIVGAICTDTNFEAAVPILIAMVPKFGHLVSHLEPYRSWTWRHSHLQFSFLSKLARYFCCSFRLFFAQPPCPLRKCFVWTHLNLQDNLPAPNQTFHFTHWCCPFRHRGLLEYKKLMTSSVVRMLIRVLLVCSCVAWRLGPQCHHHRQHIHASCAHRYPHGPSIPVVTQLLSHWLLIQDPQHDGHTLTQTCQEMYKHNRVNFLPTRTCESSQLDVVPRWTSLLSVIFLKLKLSRECDAQQEKKILKNISFSANDVLLFLVQLCRKQPKVL